MRPLSSRILARALHISYRPVPLAETRALSTASSAYPPPASSHGSQSSSPSFDPSILPYLCCPLSKQPLTLHQSSLRSSIPQTDESGAVHEVRVAYPIIDGVAVMALERAAIVEDS